MNASLRIVDPGVDSSIQDHGRADGSAVGLPRAGFVDPATARWLNASIGNPASAALIETRGGLVVEIEPDVAYATSSGSSINASSRRERVHVDPRSSERWAYLAVGGSIDVPTVGGSRSRDTLNGIGPLPLAAGTTLPTGVQLDTTIVDRPSRDRVILCNPGPHADSAGPLDRTLVARVTEASSRTSVELRLERPLEGRALQPSSWTPVLPGAIVVTSDDTLRVILANHPPLSDLPVCAMIATMAGLSSAVQALEGGAVRLRFCDASDS